MKNIIDIFIISLFNFIIIYFIFRTYAWKVLFLILLLLSSYYLIKFYNLTLSNLYFSYSLSFGVLIILIIFQKEIRKFIESFDLLFMRKSRVFRGEIIVEEIMRSLNYFSQNKIGCLLVFRKRDELRDKVYNGILLQAQITSELLISIFQKNSPLHDGAVIIDRDKILLASVILPLSNKIFSGSKKGTRHRAGLGITEESDSFSIIVSEESGEISYAENSEINLNVSSDFVKDKLLNYYLINNLDEKIFLRKIFNFKTLISSLIIALVFSFSLWTLVNYQKTKIQKIVYIPISFKDLKEDYSLSYVSSDKIKVILSGYNFELNRLKENELRFTFNLKDMEPGTHSLLVKEASINIPQAIEIIKTEPEVIKLKITTKKIEQK